MAAKFQMYSNSQERGAAFAHENQDCTVRALASACGIPYAVAHDRLKNEGRIDGKGFHMALFMDRHKELFGHTVTRVPLTVRRVEKLRLGGSGYLRPTMAQKLGELGQGRYIVTITGHAFAVIDGVVIDTWQPGVRSRVYGIWKLDPIQTPTVDVEDENRRRELREQIERLEKLLGKR